MKFGGSSVSTPERIKNVVSITEKALFRKPVVVCSAFGGVTNQLIELTRLAVNGHTQWEQDFQKLASRHLDAVRALVPPQRQSIVSAQIKIQLNELEDVLHGIFLVKEYTPRSLDYIMSFGERLSACIISEAFTAMGIPAHFADARRFICTNNRFGAAQVDFPATKRLISEYFKNVNSLPVVTGFIASTPDGQTTTLGRSGSDYTAAILAAALDAHELEIWTDVDGMMTADPKLVKKAFTIPEMSYEEAMELSHFGAKVIFPATMRPVMQKGIPIHIKNSFNPEGPGTVIRSGPVNGKLVKGISSIAGISLLNIQGSGMVGVVGVSRRLFEALATQGVNVILISQASSEHSICIAVEASQGKMAKEAIENEFRYELRDRLIDGVHLSEDHNIIALVGDGMRHHPGISGRMFSALGKNGINVTAIAQGSSERNISAVIADADCKKALTALHDTFFLSKIRTLNLFVAGTGLIGSTLFRQIAGQQQKLAAGNHLELRLAGVANSRFMLFDADGIDFNTALTRLNKAGEPMSLEAFRQCVTDFNLPNSVFVDCTASEEVAALYHHFLSASVAVVTPNKKANSGAFTIYRALKQISTETGAPYLYETNVSAGLPVISTLNDLLSSGDRIQRIEAVLSGTLNYIFSSFTKGKNFSEVVAEAREKGFTEPDPRDDLSGMDVARKMLILARETGLEIEPWQVEAENLVPPDCRKEMPVELFMQELKKHNPTFEALRKKAEEDHARLRYVAVLDNEKISIGLKAVPPEHPFYSLMGSDNMLIFTTRRYNERPMIIRGPGAGAEVTAAGVFADIIRIGNQFRQIWPDIKP